MNFVKYGCIILIITIVLSCQKESFYTGSNASLSFSPDTVAFDTVFTSIGSATQSLIVHNPYNQFIKISLIALEGGAKSPFIININGVNSSSVTNIEIGPKDSLFIFIQFFLNQTGINNPLFIKDSLLFKTNNHLQYVKLLAYGQDVHIINNSTLGTQTWPADKPYLIYGTVMVDSLSTLTIAHGATLYFHRNANLVVKGSLIANGNFKNNILFLGDRLENIYNNIPGQWGGVILQPGSHNNSFNWVVMKNGTSGLQSGGYDEKNPVDLMLSNTIIQTMSYSCLLAFNSTITSYNCVLANGSTYTCGLKDGGLYNFYQCTIVNYNANNVSDGALYISDYDNNNLVNSGNFGAGFYNTIIDGNNPDEVYSDLKGSYTGEPYFENCLVESKMYINDTVHFSNCIWNKNPDFENIANLNFQPDSISAARNMGNPSIGQLYPFDLNMNSRILNKQPDIGAYQYIQK